MCLYSWVEPVFSQSTVHLGDHYTKYLNSCRMFHHLNIPNIKFEYFPMEGLSASLWEDGSSRQA